jgi:hypothetical protein
MQTTGFPKEEQSMRAAITVLFVATLLSGCVTFSPAPTVEDKHDCDLEVANSHYAGSLSGTNLFRECMRAKGYTQMCGPKACPAWSM